MRRAPIESAAPSATILPQIGERIDAGAAARHDQRVKASVPSAAFGATSGSRQSQRASAAAKDAAE